MGETKTSKELKERIRFLEAERKENGQHLKSYIRPMSDSIQLDQILPTIKLTEKAPVDIKSFLVKTLVELLSQFIVNKLFEKKTVYREPKSADIVVEIAIENAINRNATVLNADERKMFKIMLHQYLVSN